MNILACDLGGTNTRILLAPQSIGELHSAQIKRYKSGEFTGLASIVSRFLAETETDPTSVVALGAAVAGPITPRGKDYYAKLTNLPWELDSALLQHELGIQRVRLLNDFEAAGYGIETLGPDDLEVLHTGRAVVGAPRVLIGAGTGLGHALLIWHDGFYHVYPSEGGHVEFGPADAVQRELLDWLLHHGQLDRVSYERVVSGGGLIRLYQFFAMRDAESAPARGEIAAATDQAALISQHAQAGTDAAAVAALNLFVRVYGQQAGNLALTCLARGGVYVAGGIAPQIMDQLRSGEFLSAFKAKGRMAHVLDDIPVKVVTNTLVGLRGAARFAQRLADADPV